MSVIEGFAKEAFSWDDHALTLFRKGEGPGVILLHELPGLTQETVDLARWIADQGFHVVMPLLFGTPMQNPYLGLAKLPLLCVRREFNCFSAGKSSPITSSLRALCRKVHAERGGPGVGAIGMCYTGGFVLAMLVEPALLAPVTAQPSLPFFKSGALDVEPEALTAASRRSDSMSLLGLRFENDWRCRAARFSRLGSALAGEVADGAPRFHGSVVPGKGHATLTFDYPLALERGVDTRQLLLEHLRGRLFASGKKP
jgi:dienelactone hydrolase